MSPSDDVILSNDEGQFNALPCATAVNDDEIPLGSFKFFVSLTNYDGSYIRELYATCNHSCH